MFITAKNQTIKNNDVLYFEDTSVRLSSSQNVFLISDTRLDELNVRLRLNAETSKSFKLYSLPKKSYMLQITGTATASGTYDIFGTPVAITSGETAAQILTNIKTAIVSTDLFDIVDINTTTIRLNARLSGLNDENELAEGTNQLVSGAQMIFTNTVVSKSIIDEATELSIESFDYFVQNSKHIYKINLIFTPEYEQAVHDEDYSYLHKTVVDVEYGPTGSTSQLSFTAIGRAIHVDSKLTVALQNVKKYISEDYYQAFFDSKLNVSEQDQTLLNRKRKEYLVQMFELTGFVGAYRSLIAAIEYFGWGELLTIKEYWKSIASDDYKLTSIKNQVLDKIEKQLIGYRKSNQMSLTYQINRPSGTFDDDGLPIYENVLTDTETVLTKLYAMRRVLEEDFLTLNTKIVDITGEFSATVGAELNAWLNESKITKVRLNENTHSEIKWSIKDFTVHIEEHQFLANPFAYEVDSNVVGSETLQTITPTPTTSSFDKQYFDILELLHNESEQTDFDFATKYARKDFGLIELDITEINTSLYTNFKYILYNHDNGTKLFESNVRPIAELGTGIKCGVCSTGNFKIVLTIRDHYGNMSIVGSANPIVIANRPVNFKIAKHVSTGELKDLRLQSTIEDLDNTTTDNFNVVDTIDETLDINNYDPTTNTPTHTILKKYETTFDSISTYTIAKELTGIPANKLKDIPAEVWGYKYGTMIVDFRADDSNGARTLRMKLFEHHDWTEFTYTWNNSSSELHSLQQIIQQLNNLPDDNVLSKFTYNLNWYSDDPDATIASARPMIRFKAKEHSMTVEKIFVEFDAPADSSFTDKYAMHDVTVFSSIDAVATVQIVGTTASILTLVVDDETYTISSQTFADADVLLVALRALKTANDIDNISFWKRSNDSITITCQGDFSIEHAQLGKHVDIYRGSTGTRISYIEDGADIKIAEPVYAFLDDDSKMNSANVTWKLKNALTNSVITTQYAQAFRYVITTAGSYTLECETTDAYGTTTTVKPGVFLVDAI